MLGTSLNIPLEVTDKYESSENHTKLCIDGLIDLISVAESIGADDNQSKRSMAVITSQPAATDRRRSGGGTDGDLQ